MTGKSGRKRLSRVLVVDDHEMLRSGVSLALVAAGYCVDSAADGLAALAAVSAARPDVVVLDLRMPILDGYATLARLRADPTTAGIPVVIATAADDQRSRSLAEGATAFIAKPIDARQLLREVSLALG
jgi:two-component system cell cycle response regulator DivK